MAVKDAIVVKEQSIIVEWPLQLIFVIDIIWSFLFKGREKMKEARERE